MTCQASSFLPNPQLHSNITLLVDQYNIGILSEQETAQRVNHVIGELYNFAHIHPQPAREGLGKLLAIRNVAVQSQTLASMVPLFAPISIIYLSIQLNAGHITCEEAASRGNQILERVLSWVPTHLTLAREGLGMFLNFGIEEIQKKAVESLSNSRCI